MRGIAFPNVDVNETRRPGTMANWTAYCSDGIWQPAVWDVFGIVFLERGNAVQFSFEDGGHPVQNQFGTLGDPTHMSGTLEGHDEGSPWDFYGTWSASMQW